MTTFLHRTIFLALTIAAGFAAGRATATPLPGLAAVDAPAPPSGGKPLIENRALGERCATDCQCESRECKLFRCVKRDLDKHPMLKSGQRCSFPGDCASCVCAKGLCE